MQETPSRPRPQQQKPKQKSSLSLSKLLSTRGGTMGVALVVAVIGAGVLLVFLNQYRQSVDDENQPVTVLVAKDAIAKGTPGEIIATSRLFETTTLPQSEARDGALTDAGTLRGKAAAREILPGQQLTASQFTASNDPITDNLTGYDRAVGVPVEKIRGIVGKVEAGDHVDVLAGFTVDDSGGASGIELRPVFRTLIQNALVLEAPKEEPATSRSSSGQRRPNQRMTLRMSDEQAAAMAYASEFGHVWITLRPPAGARQSRVTIVRLRQLLEGLPPITLEAEAGRR